MTRRRLQHSVWGRQSCLQPAILPAGPAGKRVRSLKDCPTNNNARSSLSSCDAPFDRLAATYDERWTASAIGRAQRNLVWREFDALFRSGEHILDIGCGTGEDAAHLTALGVTVSAVDSSPAMVRLAQARGVAATLCPAEDLAQIGATFDGAISNFGALNCVEDLPAVATSLAALLRPGGRAAICLLGPCCAWETLYYAARGQFAKAFRRASDVPYQGITVRYPTTAQVRAAFAPRFHLVRWTGIGLLVPPSYIKLPDAVVRLLAACDRVLARLPILRALADHRLFLLVRK